MLVLLVLLLATHQVDGQLQCPRQVSPSFRGEVDLSSFSVLLEQPEGVRDGGNASMSDEDQCKLTARLNVHCIVILLLYIFVKVITHCSTGFAFFAGLSVVGWCMVHGIVK